MDSAQIATDNQWVLVATVPNPNGEQTEFVTGVDPGFYAPRFDGSVTLFTRPYGATPNTSQ